MAAQGKTANYNIPLYQPDNTTSYLVTWNQAMETIDTVCKNIADNGGDTEQDLQTLQSTVEQVSTQVTDLQTATSNLQKQISNFTPKNNTVDKKYCGSPSGSCALISTNNGYYGIVKMALTGTSTAFSLTVDTAQQYIVFSVDGNPFGFSPATVTRRDSDNTPTAITNNNYWFGSTYQQGTGIMSAYMFYDAVTNKTYFNQTQWRSDGVYAFTYTFINTYKVIEPTQ